MVIASIYIQDKSNKIRFFEEPFLFVKIGIDIMLEIPFLTFSNAKIQFYTASFTWRTYS